MGKAVPFVHTDAHICKILRTRGGSKSLPSVSVISDFLHTALGTGCKQNLRKRRSPPAQSVGLHTQSPPNRTVTTEKDTYDQSNMLTEAWCRGTPTTGFQTQDPKPSLQKWGNFRHLEPTVRHPKESRHQGSRFMMGEGGGGPIPTFRLLGEPKNWRLHSSQEPQSNSRSPVLECGPRETYQRICGAEHRAAE